MTAARVNSTGCRLIVNADDFGLSAGVNSGIIEAHERGIVTAASLMVRWPAAEPAAAYAREHPRLDVGLHLDLGEWICRGGESWEPLYEVVDTADGAAVTAEVERQLSAFRKLLGRDPSHIDSHQHVHRDEPARDIVVKMARRLGVSLRHFSPGTTYWGQFYGQSDAGDSYPELVSVDAMLALLAALPPAGVVEVGCHPGVGQDVKSMYVCERALEVQTLCDPRVRAAVTDGNVRLCTFSDVHPL
jgi:predicted glycoside hydrolase/deacetylase ChbG (UPF0249 family)